jgi:hypothetical protein
MCVEKLSDEATLLRVKRVLLDVDAIPYVPQLFTSQNPPKPVSIQLLLLKMISILPLLTENFL